MKKNVESQPEKKADNIFLKVGRKALDVAGEAKAAVVNAVDKNGDGKVELAEIGLGEQDIQAAKEKAQ